MRERERKREKEKRENERGKVRQSVMNTHLKHKANTLLLNPLNA